MQCIEVLFNCYFYISIVCFIFWKYIIWVKYVKKHDVFNFRVDVTGRKIRFT